MEFWEKLIIIVHGIIFTKFELQKLRSHIIPKNNFLYLGIFFSIYY